MKKSILRECLRISIEKNTPLLHPEYGNFHHFSFIIQYNRIVSWSTNRNSGKPPIKYGYTSIHKSHSEFDAYRQARKLLLQRRWECVNIRLNKSNELRMSAPCKCCSKFLYLNGCTKVYFTTQDGFAEISLNGWTFWCKR